jgi:hypothetical protein
MLALAITLVAFLVSWQIIRRSAGRQNVAGALHVTRPVYSFGDVTPAQMPTAVFTLRNASGESINIADLIPSCWCVSARCRTDALSPGGTARVLITFNATLYSDYQGPFSKYVSVLYRVGHDTRLRVLRIFIMGNITDDAPFFAYPSTVDIGNVRAGATIRSTVYLTGWSDALKTIPAAVVLLSGCKRDFMVGSDFKSAPNLDREMRVTVKIPATATPGRFRSRAVFIFKKFSPVVITVMGRIVPSATGHRPAGEAVRMQK